MSIRIRALQNADHDQWLPLWQGYLDFYNTTLAEGVNEKTWARLVDPEGPFGGFAAVSGEEMIGFVTYFLHPSTWSHTDYCYLEDLYVTEAGRGNGTGRALIEAVYARAEELGSERVYWITDHDNHQAQQLYDRIAVRTGFIQYRHGKGYE